MDFVYIENRPNAQYCPRGDAFGPSIMYPEYPFEADSLSHHNNEVYDMVRECLHGLNLDKEHYGTVFWNPMKDYIIPGNQVLIKPNWVMDYNYARHVEKNALECLVTHPACLRAICDYCIIALNGQGKIIIADAPMQDCNLERLLESFGYNDLLQFYLKRGVSIEFKDLRKYKSIFNKYKVIIGQEYKEGTEICVDLNNLSMHEKRKGHRKYQVDNYDSEDTAKFQNDRQHIYSINAEVLKSDVIINFCKPKTHRLAGFTAAMKNMVGIAYDKASLPHRVSGSVVNGGDAYPEKSRIKECIDAILERKIKNEKEHKILKATIDRYIYGALYVIERKFGRTPIIKGIWNGNDTIWRTIIDLNYIEQYANKEGTICSSKQRKILNFGDMIIAGEHNGPCSPEPKQLGILICAPNAVAMDLTVAKIMNLYDKKIPLIDALINGECVQLVGDCLPNKICILSNRSEYSGNFQHIIFPSDWQFRVHDNWK